MATKKQQAGIRQLKAQQVDQPLWSERMARGLKEGLMILLFFLSIFLLVALSTFHVDDPGWTHIGRAVAVHNAAGSTGALLADVLMSLFGYLAFLFPVLIGYRAWVVFRDNSHVPFNWPMLGLQTLGFLLTMLSATALAYLHFEVAPGTLPALDAAGRNPAGGLLGIELGSYALAHFNQLGATLLLLAFFLTSLTVFTGISWIHLMDRIGHFTLKTIEWLSIQQERLRSRFKTWRLRQDVKQAKKARAKVIEKEKVKQAKRSPIKITKTKKATKRSDRAEKERQTSLFQQPPEGKLPPIALLDEVDNSKKKGYSAETLDGMSRLLELKLRDFNIDVEVVNVLPGPVVTRFEIQPAPGIKASRITNLAKDLARSLAVISVRVVEVIPGKTVMGIEIPNESRDLIRLSEVIASEVYEKVRSPLALALGKDISGEPIVTDLAKMPHLLVAGTTGSGKSVGLNAMLLSMLFKATPDQLRLIMIDPKMLELSVYDDIPHLLTPVVTDMDEAANALRWSVAEMERRYRLMAAMGVRNLAGYNRKIREANKKGEPIKDPLHQPTDDQPEGELLEELPYIVVVVDEFADMMMIVGKKVEELIARIAQKARAAGIHLILATQRPSVDVITGLIKANVPSRIGFQVSSKIDSRTILDQGGAEQLLGYGDMLYLPPGTSLPIRVHGAFVDDDEVHRVCNDWRKRGEPAYMQDILDGSHESSFLPPDGSAGGPDDESDSLYDQAVAIVTESRNASVSSVQRRLKIGYNRAARMVEAMEAAGLVSAVQSNGKREVLAPPPP